MEEPLRYLALGDSYTIGTGASDDSRAWPSIVASRLAGATGREVALTNPAVNGFTTDDLIQHELPLARGLKPHFATILIGVNDLVRGKTPNRYRANLTRIYDEVAATVRAAGHIAAVSIPVWSYTPAAADFGGADHVARATTTFNAVAEKEALGRGFSWIDISEASQSGVGKPGWIAADNLHPGDEQYAAWADAIWEALRDSWTRAASSP
jgi:lysophospholipase L1-like esterase